MAKIRTARTTIKTVDFRTVRPVTVERIRGSARQKLCAEILAQEPFCRACASRGLRTPSVDVDHIVPLAYGGTYARSNLQALCEECHKVKTAADFGKVRRK